MQITIESVLQTIVIVIASILLAYILTRVCFKGYFITKKEFLKDLTKKEDEDVRERK